METNLYEKLTKLSGLLKKKQFNNNVAWGPMADPTRGQGRILAILKLKDGISTKDLSYMLGIRISSLNELLGKMEKNGYIERVPSEDDKRVILIKITEKGREAKQFNPNPNHIFECLSENEQRMFGEYLDRIIDAVEKELKGNNPNDFEEFNKKREEAFARFFNEKNFSEFGGKCKEINKNIFEGVKEFADMGCDWVYKNFASAHDDDDVVDGEFTESECKDEDTDSSANTEKDKDIEFDYKEED